MTTELTKAAQQALEQLEFLNACYPHKTAADAIASLQSALTQRPAAQSEAQTLAHNMMLWREDAVHNGNEYVPVHVRTLEKVIAQLRDMPAPQQATPEPVGEHISRAEAIRLINALIEGDTLPPSSLELLRELTRPAPGVPESPCQLRKRFEQHMRDVFACKDTAFLSIDGGKTYLDGGMDNHWRTWLAAQAKQ